MKRSLRNWVRKFETEYTNYWQQDYHKYDLGTFVEMLGIAHDRLYAIKDVDDDEIYEIACKVAEYIGTGVLFWDTDIVDQYSITFDIEQIDKKYQSSKKH